MLIQLHGEKVGLYSYYLKLYESKFEKIADASIRTEAFFCVKNGTIPHWLFMFNG